MKRSPPAAKRPSLVAKPPSPVTGHPHGSAPFGAHQSGPAIARSMTILSSESMGLSSPLVPDLLKPWLHEHANCAAMNAACVVAENHGYRLALVPATDPAPSGDLTHAIGPMLTASVVLAQPASPAATFDPYEAGRRAIQRLKDAEGGAISRTDAAKLLNISLPALYTRVRKRQVVSWTDANGRLRFPRWQFGENGLLPGIASCLRVLGPLDEWAVMRYFLAPNTAEDNKSALQFIREGDIRRAVEMAKRASNHG